MLWLSADAGVKVRRIKLEGRGTLNGQLEAAIQSQSRELQAQLEKEWGAEGESFSEFFFLGFAITRNASRYYDDEKMMDVMWWLQPEKWRSRW